MSADATKVILYVEDDPVNFHLVKAIFAPRADMKIVSAPDGKSGLDLARQHRPQLILLDLDLPDMNGDEFVAQQKAVPEIAATPVIVLTGDWLPVQRRRFLALGVAAYVTKPFDIAEFEKIVEECLRRDEEPRTK